MCRIKFFWLIAALSFGLSSLPGLAPVAQAQGFFGVGIGSGSGYGSGLWGTGGRYNGGGFYGAGFTLRPSHYTAPITRLETDTKTDMKKEQAAAPNYGILEGFIRLCPPQGKPAPTTGKPPAQPSGPCAASPAELEQVAVVASPYGLTQWVGTQPDATGHYRMTLIPGGYLIQASNPEIKNHRPVEIIVEPGRTTRYDFQLGPD